MARDPNKNRRQAAVLNRVVILEKRYDADWLAGAIGVSRSWIYKAAENSLTIPAWIPPAIYRATRDVEFFAELCGASDLGLQVEDNCRAESATGIWESSAQGTTELAKLQQVLVAAMADDRIDDRELALLTLQARRLTKAIEQTVASARRKAGAA